MNMPTRPRITSGSESEKRSSRGSHRSRASRNLPASNPMDFQEFDRCPLSSSSYTYSSRDREVTDWLVARDHFAATSSTYVPGRLPVTGTPLAEASFMIPDSEPIAGMSWDAALSMEHLMLEPSPAYSINDPYDYSTSGGSPEYGSQNLSDHLPGDPLLTLASGTFNGPSSLAVGMDDMAFQNAISSAFISYDSGSSVFASPPLSPELPGHGWSEISQDCVTESRNVASGASEFLYPHAGVMLHGSSPPSPPGSDFDGHAALETFQPVSNWNQMPVEIHQQQVSASRIGGSQVRGRDFTMPSSSKSVRQSGSVNKGTIHANRPVQRVLKPASEKPRDLYRGLESQSVSDLPKPKEKQGNGQPRNHHLYKALPGSDGLFRCPFARDGQCTHTPTKQKCGYESVALPDGLCLRSANQDSKYLDSHLKPYQCKNPDCQELRFSSNACLFRHEREAHGMHFYGKNPHLCHFAGCERATEGFPRRWNLHDHMRRVHKYDATQTTNTEEDYSDGDVAGKRKGTKPLESCQMKRTSSSQAKARAASGSIGHLFTR
jgi:hypothetical protein